MKIKLVSTLALAAALIAAVLIALPIGQASAAPEAAPPAALKIVRTVSLLASNGITEAATGSAVYAAGYATADCYSVVDVGSAQTVTLVYSHSADASNWVTLETLTAVSADGTSFTRTVPYGNYLRASASLAGANAVTVTARCVLKD